MSKLPYFLDLARHSLLILSLAHTVFPSAVSAQDDAATKAKDTDKDPDYSVLLGIGSLITGSDETNYRVANNTVLQSLNVGRSTPQFLTGLSFRLPFRDFGARYKKGCTPTDKDPCLGRLQVADKPWGGIREPKVRAK